MYTFLPELAGALEGEKSEINTMPSLVSTAPRKTIITKYE